MDKSKTGRLIAAARKERALTQKELARMLHVSDRAVSKWERGAGFPDISLLEPLASALGLTVLDLLRGERRSETDVDTAVKEALDAFQEKQRVVRREKHRVKCLLCGIAIVFVICLLLMGFLRIPVKHIVQVGVYENGIQTSIMEVQVEGSIRLSLLRPTYWGQLRVSLDRVSMGPERKLTFKIPIRPAGEPAHVISKSWRGNIFEEDRPFIGNNFCLTFFMQNFAFDMTDGRVVATTPAMYARYVKTYGGIPLQNVE